MKMKKIVGVFMLMFLLAGCSVGPRPIQYGTDQCAHCDMTIIDARYGTELVTKKGKIYTFDSIECMIDFLQDKLSPGEEVKFAMVTPYNKPSTLVEAAQADYLHSKAFPSPMGMYLTAFDDDHEICASKREHGGMIFSWDELLQEFDSLNPAFLSSN
jgi:copper chaperone NosL